MLLGAVLARTPCASAVAVACQLTASARVPLPVPVALHDCPPAVTPAAHVSARVIQVPNSCQPPTQQHAKVHGQCRE
jgi:hypothetical protein